MENKIVFIADIADDIDDVIAIEYLNSTNLLDCVVLDGKSRDIKREDELKSIGVIFKEEIPVNSKILFCGGALTKIAEFIKNNEIELLVANGGYAGSNIVPFEKQLSKFKNRESIRTYNFNMDIDSAMNVLNSKNIKEILLVSKNVCHDIKNTHNIIHKETFLDKYNLSSEKRLHDLLMVKEGVNHILNNEMICEYKNVKLKCIIKEPNNMSTWGSYLSGYSHIKISVSYIQPH